MFSLSYYRYRQTPTTETSSPLPRLTGMSIPQCRGVDYTASLGAFQMTALFPCGNEIGDFVVKIRAKNASKSICPQNIQLCVAKIMFNADKCKYLE